MHVSTPTARTRRARAVAVCLTLLALLAPASPASADVFEPGGGGGGGNGGGTTGDTRGGSYGCTAKDERVNNGYVFTRPAWPLCQPGRWSLQSSGDLCPTGYLVYRFYGRRDGRINAVTASKVNGNDHLHCRLESPVLFYPNAQDQGGNGGGSPFAVGALTNPQGDRVALSENRRITSNPPMWPARNPQGLVTTAPGAQGPCTGDQWDPLAVALRGKNEPLKAAYQEKLYSIYERERAKYAPRTALTYVNGAAANPQNRTISYHDNRACSSPWDFTSASRDVESRNFGAQRVVGTCAVKLVRRASRFSGTNAQGGRETRFGYQLSSPEAVAELSDGEKRNLLMAPVPKEGEPAPNVNYIAKWKEYIAQHADELGPNQPHQIYVGEGKQPAINRPLSAQQAAARAQCAEAPRAQLDATDGEICLEGDPACDGGGDGDNPPPPPPPTQPSASTNIIVNVPNVFQVGGVDRLGVVTATRGPFSCTEPSCRLSRLDYTVTLEGIGGYIKCANGVPSRSCEFEETYNERAITAGEDGNIVNSHEIRAAFYSGGSAAKKVRVTLVSSGAYRWEHCHPVPLEGGGSTCQNHTHENVGFTPTVGGGPNPDIQFGGGSMSVDVDVIGANNQTTLR